MKRISILLLLISLSVIASGQKHERTDAHIIGHVKCCGEHIPFANVYLKNTTIGTTTDATGHFQLINMPEGTHTVCVRTMGYKLKEEIITLKAGETKEVKFELEEDALGLEEVVITGDRNEKNRKESSVIVNTLTPKLFTTTQAVSLSDGLNFSPGLRMESNCQNCGFSQVRMNGMDGPYSQILINSRPIFSGLAGVYGLELIPSNMIERIEVVRGGGSALYGSNAIAGTVNLILKDPINNSWAAGYNYGLSGVGVEGAGDPAADMNINFNTSLVTSDNKSGLAVYGFHRTRDPFDYNGDSFSELVKIKNTTMGARFFHRFGTKARLTLDVFNISESRRGGDKFDFPLHEAGIAEAVAHDILSGAVNFDLFTREKDHLSVYFSGQGVDRDSYYGAEQSLKDYGKTNDFTYATGLQYIAFFNDFTLTSGVENRGSQLNDIKLGYPDFENAVINADTVTYVPHTENTTVADQQMNTVGAFAQLEYKLKKLSLSAGARFDHYSVIDNLGDNDDKTGNVLSPRLTVKYDILETLQGRLSYSQGYRAPQIFDEDLHIETSGSRKVIHENDPNLRQETSHSFMASADINRFVGKVAVNFLVEGFYTRLNDAFVNEFGEPDENGVVVYTRKNAEGGATVQGVNMELNIIPSKTFNLKSGFTLQQSFYDETQEFDEKSFFRTPDNYGYLAADWSATKRLTLSLSGNYTGSMLVPYFGAAEELRISDVFMDMGVKIRYTFKINGASMQLYAGVKNVFDSYQKDLDSGIYRDPGYVYGPTLPRTIYAGFKLGNML